MRNNWGGGGGGEREREFFKNMQNILGNLHREIGGRERIKFKLQKTTTTKQQQQKRTQFFFFFFFFSK